MLTNVAYNPVNEVPAFDNTRFDYILTLDTGASSTNTRVTKTPGVLDATIVHKSMAAGQGTRRDVIICEACDYDTVRLRTQGDPNKGSNLLCSRDKYRRKSTDRTGVGDDSRTPRSQHSDANSGGLGVQQDYLVDNLVHDDQIVTTTTYSVLGNVVRTQVYTWTLQIPTPELVNADFTNAPGTQDPAFNKEVFAYIMDLPVGTQSTTTEISAETPETLDLVIKHESASRGIVGASAIIVCENCNFQSVSWPFINVPMPTQTQVSPSVMNMRWPLLEDDPLTSTTV